jgi:hypothetical protein
VFIFVHYLPERILSIQQKTYILDYCAFVQRLAAESADRPITQVQQSSIQLYKLETPSALICSFTDGHSQLSTSLSLDTCQGTMSDSFQLVARMDIQK